MYFVTSDHFYGFIYGKKIKTHFTTMVQALEEVENQDLSQAFQLLAEMNNNLQQVSQLVDNMVVRVKTGEISTEKGLSFLEIKYHMLLNYLINLTYIVLKKSSGEKIESDPSVDRLIEIRTVLEKIRPIDSKLKYQIDKLVKTAIAGNDLSNDHQSLRANPDNLVNKLDDAEDSDESDTETKGTKERLQSNIYVPPKLAAVHFDGATSRIESEKREAEKSKKQLLNSRIIRELKDEYSDAPQEVSSGMRATSLKISKFEQDRTEYEESYLTRLPVTKADKNRRKQWTTMGVLGDEIVGRGNRSDSSKRKRKGASKKGKGSKRRKS